MQDLKEITEEHLYETFRKSVLERNPGFGQLSPVYGAPPMPAM